MAHHGSRHRHLCQQVLDMFKDEGRLLKAIRFTGKTKNTTLELGKYGHGFYHKPAKDNKLLRHDLGNRDHQKNYADVRRKPLEFQVGGKVMLEITSILQSSTLIVERINVLEKYILECKLVHVDDDGKPLEKVDYPDNLGSDDEVEPVDNEITIFLASKLMGVGYGLKSLLEQWRGNEMDDEYDLYEDDMYEGQNFPNNIQAICDNLDIRVRGRKKK
ncbi:hypothetical protein Tco_0486354 [Tanacetum coccineum]